MAPLSSICADRTEDGFLGGRLRIAQPAKGYRAAIDPVFLAAAVQAKAGDRVLDAGCGVGVAALCLHARVPGLELAGIEKDEEAAELAAANAAANAARLAVVAGDVADLPAPFGPDRFDHVLSNPPYHDQGTPPPDAAKARAHAESLPLADWIGACLSVLKPKGTLTLVLPAGRVPDAVARLTRGAGDITLFPLWPRPGAPAHRVLLAARKTTRAPFRLLPGLVLHAPDAGYTPEADAILRGARPLPLHGGR